MAGYSLNLAQPHVKTGNHPRGEIFIGLGIDQISQRSPEIKGLGSVLQGGIDLRGGGYGGIKISILVHERDGLAIVDQLAVLLFSHRFSPQAVGTPHRSLHVSAGLNSLARGQPHVLGDLRLDGKLLEIFEIIAHLLENFPGLGLDVRRFGLFRRLGAPGRGQYAEGQDQRRP